jgi:hypothetical protein
VTEYLLDIASYQGDLTLADVARAGFSAVNLKISHGLGQRSVHPNLAGYAAGALVRGLGICTFHYLTGEGGGAAQATYAYQRLLDLGLVDGTAHQADVEAASVTERIVAEYVATMQALLGRPIIVYTGDWYWASRGWRGSALTPYLWAVPNDGHPGRYPGDTSSAWTAGYGGWLSLAVMQYAVEPLRYPDGTAGTIKVSKSAVRDPTVWAALTGGGDMAWVLTAGLQNLRRQVNARWPNRDKASDGTIGDTAHQARTSSHNPDDTAGSTPAWGGDADTTPEVRAFDQDVDLREPGTTAQMEVDHIRRLPGLAAVIRYMIFNGKMYHSRDGFAPTSFTGDPHTGHIHFEGAWSQAGDNNTTFDFKLEEVGDMPLDATDLLKVRTQAALGVYDALWSAAKGVDVGDPVRIDWETVGKPIRDNLQAVVGKPVDQASIIAAVNAADQISDADKQAIAAALLCGMDYGGIAVSVVEALPQDLVESVVAALAARLQG